jgi:hypothetical protein
MSIVFEEDQGGYSRGYTGSKPSGMAQWLIDKGIAPNENVANVVLLIVAVIAVSVTIWMWIPDSNSDVEPLTRQQKEEIKMQSGFNELPSELQRSLLGE